MNIGYIMIGFPKPSIARKISSQTESINKISGCAAKLYIYTHPNPTSASVPTPSAEYIFFPEQHYHAYFRALLLRKKVFEDLTQRVLRDKLDILYIRGVPSDPFINRFLETCPAKVVFEINSVQFYERVLQKRPWIGWFEEFYTRKALPKANGFVSVSSSAREYYAKMIKKNTPNIVQGNGFEIESVPLRQPPDFNGKHVRLMAIANYAKWHGIDRAVAGLAEYHGSLDISLSIAGTGSLLNDVRKQVYDLGISKQVSFLGEMYGEKVDQLFNQSHLALGALAIHRKNLRSTSAIKTGEYLSRGIPFIISGYDDNLTSMTPERFYLRIPHDDSSIDFSILEPIAEKIFGDFSLPQRMRDYATEHISIQKKMIELVEFFKHLD